MTIGREVSRVALLLKRHNRKVVFAESCTGGLAAGALTRTPGISEYHCGGMIVYRNETKTAYLGIPAKLLENPGPVSAAAARSMAEAILKRTPEAHLAAAITGYLGPQAPKRLDGVVYLCIASRDDRTSSTVEAERRVRYPAGTTRTTRQRRAVEDLLKLLGDVLSRSAQARTSPC